MWRRRLVGLRLERRHEGLRRVVVGALRQVHDLRDETDAGFPDVLPESRIDRRTAGVPDARLSRRREAQLGGLAHHGIGTGLAVLRHEEVERRLVRLETLDLRRELRR